MRTLRLTPGAKRDLGEIRRYTKAKWGRAQATRYLLGIRTIFNDLAQASVAGSAAEDIRPGYRRTRIGSHVIFFQLDEATVRIIRILHERMDFGAHL